MKITYVKKYEKNMFENVMASDDQKFDKFQNCGKDKPVDNCTELSILVIK